MFSVNILPVLFFQTVDTEVTEKFRVEIMSGGVLPNLLLITSSDLRSEQVAQAYATSY